MNGLNDSFFSIGTDYLISEYLSAFKKDGVVFLDLNTYNLFYFLECFDISEIKKGNQPQKEYVLICERKLLPLGLYYYYNYDEIYLFPSDTPVDRILTKVALNDRVIPGLFKGQALSHSEYEVFKDLYVQLLSIKESAYKRNKNINTVYDLRRSIRRKLDIRSLNIKI